MTDVQNLKLAGEADGDQRLEFLGVHRVGVDAPSQRLKGLKITVVGAGPAGLVIARNTALHGASVTVLEQAGDPRGSDAGYTDRSFNLTLDNVGRQVLGDPRAWQGGVWLNGRAIHCAETATVAYARYGHAVDAELISVPRPVLRQNLCQLAEESGVTILFHSRVTDADADKGTVEYESAQARRNEIHGDLVIFSDGLHSLATRSAAAELGTQVWPEPRNYVSALITPEHNPGLSLSHIHFWHEPKEGNFTVGIPNADGSVALLLVSLFADIAADEHPFPTPAQARTRLRRDFPHLYSIAPQLATQLPRHHRRTFCFKSVQKYRPGTKGVLIGDAGLVFPPWAGYGANQAMYGAAQLANSLVEYAGDVEDATEDYQQLQQQLSAELIAFVEGQGDFLSGPVADDPAGQSEPALSMIIEKVKRSLAYQADAAQPDNMSADSPACAFEPAL